MWNKYPYTCSSGGCVGFFTTGVCCFAPIANSVLINCILLKLFIRHNAHFVCCTHWLELSDLTSVPDWRAGFRTGSFSTPCILSQGVPPWNFLSVYLFSRKCVRLKQENLCKKCELMSLPCPVNENTSINRRIHWLCWSSNFYVSNNAKTRLDLTLLMNDRSEKPNCFPFARQKCGACVCYLYSVIIEWLDTK